MSEILTLYSSEICPFAQRIVIALEEGKADYTTYEIDLDNKPEWYAPRVNPIGKVPAIAYGGPKVDPAYPSPDSIKLYESLVLLEFIADLYPNSGLLSDDPVKRAQTRLVIDVFSTKVLPAYMGVLWKGEPPETLHNALLVLQEQVALYANPYLGGEKLNIADAAIAPFIARIDFQLQNDVGSFKEGQGPKIHDYIFKNEALSIFQKYAHALLGRESVKGSFPQARYLETARGYVIRARNAST